MSIFDDFAAINARLREIKEEDRRSATTMPAVVWAGGGGWAAGRGRLFVTAGQFVTPGKTVTVTVFGRGGPGGA